MLASELEPGDLLVREDKLVFVTGPQYSSNDLHYHFFVPVVCVKLTRWQMYSDEMYFYHDNVLENHGWTVVR